MIEIEDVFYESESGHHHFQVVCRKIFRQPEVWRASLEEKLLAQAPTREEVIEKAKATIAIQREVF